MNGFELQPADSSQSSECRVNRWFGDGGGGPDMPAQGKTSGAPKRTDLVWTKGGVASEDDPIRELARQRSGSRLRWVTRKRAL